MSVISSTYSGRRAIPLTYEYFRDHADEWHQSEIEITHETIFTYKMRYSSSVHFNHISNSFYVPIFVGKPPTHINNLFQLDMLKKYFESEKSEDFNKYAELICRS